MSRFASKTVKEAVNNYAGGAAYKQTPEMELASILLTSFAKDKYYRPVEDEIARLKELLAKVNPEFACKAAVYTRQVQGLRSISHILAAEVAPFISGKDYAKDFYTAIVRRPDDMAEILAYGKSTNWAYKSLPQAMKRGFKRALSKFDSYQLAKWRKEGNSINLVNIIHLTHPTPNKAITDLYKNRLVLKENTREAMLSNTGKIENKDSLTTTQIAELKAENLKAGWRELITSKKIAYKALVGSLVKIIKEAPDLKDQVMEILINQKMILNSLISPSELIVAHQEVYKLCDSSYVAREVLGGVEKAIELSIPNVPKFRGNTLVAVDVSASMQGKTSVIAGLFTSVLAKALNCDVIKFGSRGRYENYNFMDSLGTLYSKFHDCRDDSTNFHDIFTTANKGYERIIILSDMQGWVGYNAPTDTFNSYCKKYGVDPYIYSWDLAGYGTTQLPSRKIKAIAGFAADTFDMMKNSEESETALIDKINAIEFATYLG